MIDPDETNDDKRKRELLMVGLRNEAKEALEMIEKREPLGVHRAVDALAKLIEYADAALDRHELAALGGGA